MEINELHQAAKKVIELQQQMYETFEGSKGDYLLIAIMAGLQDAYNAGSRQKEKK